MDESASADELIDAVSECIAEIGAMGFTERFMRVVKLTGAGQVTAFAYEPEKANCLLSRNFLSEEKGGTLAATYVDGWFRADPLFERVMTAEKDACTVETLESLLPGMSLDYLAVFFGNPGFRTKVSILVTRPHFRMALNFYFESDGTDRIGYTSDAVAKSLYRLVGRTLAAHFLTSSSVEYPLPLAVLSDRERQVCIGMLAGKKAEIIAEEIGIGPSSVVTYRQRAYQKLGISSRGQLFSICRT